MLSCPFGLLFIYLSMLDIKIFITETICDFFIRFISSSYSWHFFNENHSNGYQYVHDLLHGMNWFIQVMHNVLI